LPANSQPPPSEQIPGHSSGGGLYLVGAVVLVGGAAALFAWKSCSTPQPVATQQSASVAASAPPPKDEPPPLYAPPPPPKIEEDAGVDAGPPPVAKSSGTPAAPGGNGPCGPNCKGEATGALSSALRARAQSAQGCYNRALRTSEVSGSMTVSVQVGPNGQVCSASLANDSVHSSEIASCVLGRFRGQSFPPPTGGCIVANIPISFTIKQ
jgi:outer membrane biosynthesis protein TonB